MTKSKNSYDMKSFPFDLYTRNYIVSSLIKDYLKSYHLETPISILDVGGKNGRLNLFFDKDIAKVTIFDINDNPDDHNKNYIQGDITNPHLKGKFDFVVALDVLEHIPKNKRYIAIKNIKNYSNYYSFITVPIKTPWNILAENYAREYFLKYSGKEHKWLKEHSIMDLPAPNKIIDYLLRENLQYAVINSNPIDIWLILQLSIFYIFIHAMPSNKLKKIYEKYNNNLKYFENSVNFPYRQIYVFGNNNINWILKTSIAKYMKITINNSALNTPTINNNKIIYTLDLYYRTIDMLTSQYNSFSNKLDILANNSKTKELTIYTLQNKLTTLNKQFRLKQKKIKEKSREITKLRKEIQLLSERYNNAQVLLIKTTSALATTQATLQTITNSTGVKLIFKIRKIKDKLFPISTWRGKIYHTVYHLIKRMITEHPLNLLKKLLHKIKDKMFPPHPKLYILSKITHKNGNQPYNLSNGIKIEFVSKFHNLSGIEILTFSNVSTNASLRILVSTNNAIIRNFTIKGKLVSINGRIPIHFKPIKDSYNKNVKIYIKSDSKVQIPIVYNPIYMVPKVKIYTNSSKRPKGSIDFKAIYDISVKSKYENWYKVNEPTQDELKNLAKKAINFKYKPKISIIMPTWNTPKALLIKAIESVLNQTYSNWELCIADGNSSNGIVKKILKRYKILDKRIKVIFLKQNLGIGGNSQKALNLATGDFILLLDHDDTLAPFALYEIVHKLNENPKLDFIYSDEDKIDMNDIRRNPSFKPDYSPTLLYSCNYMIHVSVMRKTIIDQIGGFNTQYDGSQDYDLILRFIEQIPADHIAHIPKILYHWRMVNTSTAYKPETKLYAYNAGIQALRDSLKRLNKKFTNIEHGYWLGSYRIHYIVDTSKKVSIIIPTKDKVNYLKRCIKSILEKTVYPNYEILIIDNNSNQSATFDYYKKIQKNKKVKIFYYKKPFNFSAINNWAVKKTTGDYLLFLNNDTEATHKRWLWNMVEHIQDRTIGAVGAKLLFPNNTIQHAGVILGIGTGPNKVAGHAHKYYSQNSHGHMGRINLIQNFSAVTGACLLTKKSLFQKVKGFNETSLAIAFNDIDYCLKLRKLGYYIIYTPYSILYHYESLSRGIEDTPEKIARFKKEITYMRSHWGDSLDNDPFYNPNLTKEHEDFSIGEPEFN